MKRLLLALAASFAMLFVAPGLAAAQSVTISVPAACTPYHLPGGSTSGANPTSIASGPKTLCSLVLINTTSTVYFFKIIDTSGSPTCSDATGVQHVYPIPAGAGANGVAIPVGASGEAYRLGLAFCITGGGADNDNSSAAPGVYVNASYR